MNHTIRSNKKYFILYLFLTGMLINSTPSVAIDYEYALGVQGGYSSSRSQFKDSSSTDKNVAEFPVNGPVLGVYANASMVTNAWRFGVEVDYTARDQSSRSSTEDIINDITSSKKLSFRNRKDVSLLIGYQFTEQVRFYLRGGQSHSSYKFEAYDSEEGSTQYRLNLHAPHYGFGVNVKLTDQFSLRTDYRFVTFSGDRKESDVSTDYEFEIHTFLLGIDYTF